MNLYQRTAKGAGGKGPRQKTSKVVKKCQKLRFSTLFDHFSRRAKKFSGQKWGALISKVSKIVVGSATDGNLLRPFFRAASQLHSEPPDHAGSATQAEFWACQFHDKH